jgi:hypothetical protein
MFWWLYFHTHLEWLLFLPHAYIHTNTHTQTQPAISNTARFILLSDAETESIMKVAGECAEGECSIDEVAALVGDLKEQQELLQMRLTKVTTMISDLETLNAKDERKDSEVRQFVKDMLRVFAHEVGGGFVNN